MSELLRIPVCADCGHAVWPARLLCPRCHSDRSQLRDATTGTVEQATAAGGNRLATVRLAAGPLVIARCEQAQPGQEVRLTIEKGAVTARREDRG